MVERYDDVWKYTGKGGSLKFNGPVVLATDYAALEARCRETESRAEMQAKLLRDERARIAELEAAIRNITCRFIKGFNDQETVEMRFTPIDQRNLESVLTVSETACEHEWDEYSINNAKSPLDPPLLHVWVKCIKCGAKSEEVVSAAQKTLVDDDPSRDCPSCGNRYCICTAENRSVKP